MNILITGSNGFVGKNLIADLKATTDYNIIGFDRSNTLEELEKWCQDTDFVFHLAGVNRPENEAEFMEGNFGLTSDLLKFLNKYNNKAPVVLSSSIQAELDQPYGRSKKAGEDLLFQYSEENDVPVYVYRFSNLFGKWSRPNYNTVVATFCHKIARDEEITISNPDAVIELCYIDDVVNELKQALTGNPHMDDKFCFVPEIYPTTVGELADTLKSFKDSRKTLMVPNQEDGLTKKLYATYLSFLPEDDFGYDLKMNVDDRGYFTEFLKSPERGQVSINYAKPGITKGQHWHHTKNEKFLVVYGEGVIRFRKIDETEVVEYPVSGEKLQVIDIPTGYTHNIENTGNTDMITVMWANEIFDPNNPDTFYEGV